MHRVPLQVENDATVLYKGSLLHSLCYMGVLA